MVIFEERNKAQKDFARPADPDQNSPDRGAWEANARRDKFHTRELAPQRREPPLDLHKPAIHRQEENLATVNA